MEPKAKHLTRKFLLGEQKDVVQPESKPTITTTQYFTLASEVLLQQTNLPAINFVRVYLTDNNNLVFNTSIGTRGTGYEFYFHTVYHTLSDQVAIDMIIGEIPWFMFILHSITQDNSMVNITISL